MPKRVAPATPTTPAQRRRLFQTWQQTGNVAHAGRTAGVGRRTFYYWKRRFESGGYAALDAASSTAPKRPHRSADALVAQIIAVRRAHPAWGKRRIDQALANTNGGVAPVSADTVKRILVDAGLWIAGTAAAQHPTEPPPTPDGTRADSDRPAALPVMAIKLAPPRVPTALVVRARLLDLLDRAMEHRLTLVSAAAGWGKTTLLSAWASQPPGRVAWLSLDELDNDGARFWIAVIAALRTALPALGNTALAMLRSTEPAPTAALVTALLTELAALDTPAPVVLIVDDFQVVNDPAVVTGVSTRRIPIDAEADCLNSQYRQQHRHRAAVW